MLKHLRKHEGFTLVEILIVVVMLAILFAIAVPIYVNYVAQARSAEAQEAINAIKSAANVYNARYGSFPTTVDQLNDLEFEQATTDRWNFTLTPSGDGLSEIRATSTNRMKGGAGKVVVLNVTTGEWSGYGFDSY